MRVIISIHFFLCSSLVVSQHRHGSLLKKIIEADTSAIIKTVLSDAGKYKLQIIYSQINWRNNCPRLSHYYYRHEPEEYFYPASMVKLPLAALALEKVHMYKHLGVNKYSLLETNEHTRQAVSDSARYSSIAENIMYMLVVSDNAAYNRLFDFVGYEEANLRLYQKGYHDVRLVQRFSSSGNGYKITGPFKLRDSTGKILYEEPEHVSLKSVDPPLRKMEVGRAEKYGRKIIRKAKDFSSGNFIPLAALHNMLISIIYPSAVPSSQRFRLSENDYDFLRQCLSIYPRETNMQAWKNDSLYYDNLRKYLLAGTQRTALDSNIRIFNKVGLAYGFVIDCAYIVDYKNETEFFLSAVIYVNENEILNDGIYEYKTVGFPFMQRLGKILYEYELNRQREECPVLKKINYSSFRYK
ncbi:MAG: class A beta-lactamase-related serine hydrolase [Cytophagaceae bacterium]|nr:class A beta-lactamase-related serine hydrolase [Cytophagaceae bacterium]MDW8456696.1 serine hydrolase [Cytophagaceae bacterium]